MSAAVALSIALQVFLIDGFSLPADSRPGARVTVIHARLDSPQSSGSPQQVETPDRNAVPASS
jgi:hypothetical protein